MDVDVDSLPLVGDTHERDVRCQFSKHTVAAPTVPLKNWITPSDTVDITVADMMNFS